MSRGTITWCLLVCTKAMVSSVANVTSHGLIQRTALIYQYKATPATILLLVHAGYMSVYAVMNNKINSLVLSANDIVHVYFCNRS